MSLAQQVSIRKNRRILQVLLGLMALLIVALFAFAYTKKAHEPNLGRGPFDVSTEGSGPTKNP